MSNNSKFHADAAAAIALLAELFPHCFAVYEARRRPLKVGIDRDLVRAVEGAVLPHELTRALTLYTSNSGYLRSLRAGAARVDLAGNPAGTVSASEAQHAAEVLAARLLRGARGKAAKPAAVTRAAPGASVVPAAARPERPERVGLAGLKQAWRERQQQRTKGRGRP